MREKIQISWNKLSDQQKESLCQNPRWDPTPYWYQMTEAQKTYSFDNPNFNSIIVWKDKLVWESLTGDQKLYLCKSSSFDLSSVWHELTEDQRDIVCGNPLFDPTPYWEYLTNRQKTIACKNPMFNFVVV